MNQSNMLDLSNIDRMAAYLEIAKFAHHTHERDVYRLAMEKIKNLLQRDLGTVLVQPVKPTETATGQPKSALDRWIDEAARQGIYISKEHRNG